jgi:hypothetical protein
LTEHWRGGGKPSAKPPDCFNIRTFDYRDRIAVSAKDNAHIACFQEWLAQRREFQGQTRSRSLLSSKDELSQFVSQLLRITNAKVSGLIR